MGQQQKQHQQAADQEAPQKTLPDRSGQLRADQVDTGNPRLGIDTVQFAQKRGLVETGILCSTDTPGRDNRIASLIR